jgi:hypothetical protein
MAKPNEKSDDYKRNQLFLETAHIVGDQATKDRLFRQYAGPPLNQVFSRLITFHLHQLMAADSEAYATYGESVLERLRYCIGELIGIGFYIYYVDRTRVRELPIRRYDDQRLKDLLMGVVRTLEDDAATRDYESYRNMCST